MRCARADKRMGNDSRTLAMTDRPQDSPPARTRGRPRSERTLLALHLVQTGIVPLEAAKQAGIHSAQLYRAQAVDRRRNVQA